jgi:hypothetical protein
MERTHQGNSQRLKPRHHASPTKNKVLDSSRPITTTVRLYGHPVPKTSGCARDALDQAFGRAAAVP